MKPTPPPFDNRDAEFAKISDLTKHFNVCRQVTVSICNKWEQEEGLRRVAGKMRRYRWRDIWTCEGRSVVPRSEWKQMKAPLLTVKNIADPERFGFSERNIRRLAENGKLPVVRLPIDEYRFREFEIEDALLDYR